MRENVFIREEEGEEAYLPLYPSVSSSVGR
jgi:hypothetical protein